MGKDEKLNIVENLLTPGKRNRPGERIIRLKAVVLHWLAAPNQRPVDTRGWWESERAVGSAHYVIGTDGAVLRTLPETEIGYHIGTGRPDPKSGRNYTDKARALFGPEAFTGRSPAGSFITPNYFAIGIEMGHLNNDPGDFSPATLKSAAILVAGILKRYSLSADAVTTHHEVVGWKNCPKLWTDKPELFSEFKERVKKLL